MTGTTRTIRGPLVAAAVLAVALTTAACSPRETGAAAVVGDRRVSTQELQDALAGLKAGNPQFAEVAQLDRLVLFDLIAEPYLVKAAQTAGLGVSDSEAQAALPGTPQADPAAVRALRGQIALNKLNQAQSTEALDAVAATLRSEGVKVSPRYGRFDSQSLSVVDAAPNWLPTPTPSPSATAPPAS